MKNDTKVEQNAREKNPETINVLVFRQGKSYIELWWL